MFCEHTVTYEHWYELSQFEFRPYMCATASCSQVGVEFPHYCSGLAARRCTRVLTDTCNMLIIPTCTHVCTIIRALYGRSFSPYRAECGRVTFAAGLSHTLRIVVYCIV